jgi:Ca2+-transporting ATPase
VVALPFSLQVWSQHNATLGRFLKTTSVPVAEGLLLVAVGAIPLVILEIIKGLAVSRRITSPGLTLSSD